MSMQLLWLLKMARAYLGGTFTKIKKKRPGIHAKTKTSRSKGSVNYKKKYKGQGKWDTN